MKDTPCRSTHASWEQYRRNQRVLATGTGTLSKRPQFEPEEPCCIVRGKGCRVWDADGNDYIDFRNALGPITLGYCYPPVDEAIRTQLERGIVFGHPSPLEGEVAELLVEMVPCAEKVRYLKTGGEAMSAAIKLARAFTGKDMVLQCGYNGWLNSLAPGASVLPGRCQEAPVGVPRALSKLHRSLPWADLEPWERAFDEHRGQIACVTVAMDYAEPFAGAEFLSRLRRLADAEGALLVMDEIVSGFRIAIGGLHAFCNVKADLAVFSKGIANGMPLSALVGRAEIMDFCDRAVVSSTFSGETLSLAAAKACLTTYREKDVIGHLAAMGRIWQDGLNALFDRHNYPLVAKGMPPCSMLCARPGASSEDAAHARDALFRAAYAHGVSLYTVCYTNFSMTPSAIAEALERMANALGAINLAPVPQTP